jgi:hypothetical protein
MRTHLSRIPGTICLLLLLVGPLALIPPAEGGKKKNRIARSVKLPEYDVAPKPGDIRIYKLTYHAWGIEHVVGEVRDEWHNVERVSGPFAYGKHKEVYQSYVRDGDYRWHQYFIVKKGLKKELELRSEERLWTYKKPRCMKKKMKFGKTYRHRNASFFEDLTGSFTAWLKLEDRCTAVRGEAWDGEWAEFDDTIVITNEYYERAEDGTISWNGIRKTTYARGIGEIYMEDEYTEKDRIYSGFFDYVTGFRMTAELAYALIDGVEYGDPKALDW